MPNAVGAWPGVRERFLACLRRKAAIPDRYPRGVGRARTTVRSQGSDPRHNTTLRARSSAVEHLTFNQVVVGSIPTGLTIKYRDINCLIDRQGRLAAWSTRLCPSAIRHGPSAIRHAGKLTTVGTWHGNRQPHVLDQAIAARSSAPRPTTGLCTCGLPASGARVAGMQQSGKTILPTSAAHSAIWRSDRAGPCGPLMPELVLPTRPDQRNSRGGRRCRRRPPGR